LATKLGVKRHHVFSPRLQDQLSDVLLAEAGLHDFNSGQMTRHAFMNNLAKIWAGLPNSSGKSHYHGFAGNKASISWTHFDAEMARIFG
jgi:muramidase (phage lysozyme)